MRTLSQLLRAVLIGALLLTAGFAAEETKKAYDIPAGDAAAALKQFSSLSGRETLFAAEAVRGVKTPAVRGELTVQEALDALLTDTGLVATVDAKTGAIAVRREIAEESKNGASRLADAQTAGGGDAEAAARTRVKDGVVQMEEYEVTGSRMRLNSGERPVQPVFTMTALDIERTGASNLGDLFQYIPAVSSYSTGISIENTNGGVGSGGANTDWARTRANIRGGNETATVLLVDGRRVARTGEKNGNGLGFDLGGIPLSAIERVEVLLDGASAIYGADAINGVINVILKKRYAGTELRLTYDNTFDTDAGVRTVSLTHGFAADRWSGLVTLSGSDNNILLLRDRELTATFDRTELGGLSDNSQPALFIGGAGSINRATGLLPGMTTNVAAIPAGSNGQGLTVASYLAAGAPFGGLDPGPQGAMTYRREKSGYARLGFEVNDRLQLTASVRMGDSKTANNGFYRRSSNLTLPAGYPGNPFGVPIRLNKVFYDLPLIYQANYTRNDEYLLAANGKLPGDWRYEVTAAYVRGENTGKPAFLPDGRMDGQILNPTLVTAEIAAGRQPTLIYDSRTQAGDSAALLGLFALTFPSLLSDLSEVWTGTARADGSLFTLPAGDVRSVIGAEFREEAVSFPGEITTNVFTGDTTRKIKSAYAEVLVPIVAPQQHWPLVHKLDVNVAVRTEDYSVFGRSTTPRYGVAWRPLSAVLIRTSYGEGFLVPPLSRTSLPVRQTTLNWTSSNVPIDPLRGNQSYLGTTYVATSGGNPNLRPQTSESWTYGVVLDVPKVSGLSLSFDYFQNYYTNRFNGVTTLADRILYFPESITRGPNLPGDQPGWAGPVIGIDTRITNLGIGRVAGYNFGLRWNRSTAWGDLTFASSGEKILSNVSQATPTSAPSTGINKRFNPMRITSSLFWNQGAWDAGVTSVYSGRYWVNSTNETLAPSRWTDDVMRWDVNAGYDFGRNKSFGEKGSAWWKRALRDTKLRLTVINAFDTEPPLDVLGLFSSSVVDVRLRRYVIDFTKRF